MEWRHYILFSLYIVTYTGRISPLDPSPFEVLLSSRNSEIHVYARFSPDSLTPPTAHIHLKLPFTTFILSDIVEGYIRPLTPETLGNHIVWCQLTVTKYAALQLIDLGLEEFGPLISNQGYELYLGMQSKLGISGYKGMLQILTSTSLPDRDGIIIDTNTAFAPLYVFPQIFPSPNSDGIYIYIYK